MSSIPLSPIENKARIHAHLETLGFLVLLPIGVLVGRYLRTFDRRWFWVHWVMQFLISGPVILSGWALGYQTTQSLFTGGNWVDTHKKIGLVLLILYLIQMALGAFIHLIKFPSWMTTRLHRPPQNYLHAFLGLVIIALAAFQVHYGMWTEWAHSLGTLHPVHMGCKHFWLSWVVVFWSLYGLGLLLLPRQWRQERNAAAPKSLQDAEEKSSDSGASPVVA